MLKNTLFLYLTLIVITLTSCIKEEPDCEGKDKVIVTTNSPVMVGDTLKFTVAGVSNIYKCIWTGPNKFRSASVNPEIPFASAFESGIYKVDVITEGGCIYSMETAPVEVGSAEAPCQLEDKTLRIGNALAFLPSAGDYENDYYNRYEMTASVLGLMWVRMNLGVQDGKIKPGVYITGLFDDEHIPQGRAIVEVGDGRRVWTIAEGTRVYVSGGFYNVTATLCDAQATAGDGSTTTVNLHMNTY